MTYGKWYLGIAMLAVVAGLFGCAAAIKEPAAPVATTAAAGAPAPYRIQPGDLLEVKFYYDPELNDQVEVRPDGRISLQLLDEVVAAGKTPAELDDELTRRYGRRINDPELTVIVRRYRAREVYVGGQVARPGVVPWSEDLTVFRALLQAGDVNDRAALDSVVVLRQTAGGQEFHAVDLVTPVEDGRAADLRLQPYDVVFVPKSTVARLGQFVKQYFTDLVPISYNLGFSWVYDLNNEVQVR